jgi:hypothetical protein
MKKYKTLIKFLFLIMFCSFLISCNLDSYETGDFLIKVDSISVPDLIVTNTPFDIEFFGTIASNGCHKFEYFNHSIIANVILIEAWGSYDIRDGVCPTTMVYLDGQKLTVTIPSPGIYTINVIQPDNTTLTREIAVSEATSAISESFFP